MHRATIAAAVVLATSAGFTYSACGADGENAYRAARARPISIPLAAFDAEALPVRVTTSVTIEGRVFEIAPTVSKTIPATNARVLSGGLVGEPGRFVLAEVEGRVAGAIWTEDGAIEFRPIDAAGGVRVIEIDNADLPGCATVGRARPVDAFPLGHGPADHATRGAPEQIIRVFVGITRAGELQMGGPAAAAAVATAAVESANTAYVNSEMTVGDAGAVQASLEIVGTYTVDPGTGLGAGTLLGALSSTSDGLMDELHILRDATGADLVSLLSESGIGACGIAYLNPDDPTRGFSVTAQSCAIGNLSFAHELGHNQGASHDAANAGSGYTPYGFGWRWNTTSGSLRRSVMAYSPGSRRPYFSNPGVFEGGGQTGDAAQADNARLIGETFGSVASFRTGTGSGAGDCDGNGTPDLLEIIQDPALDSDASGVLDSCELDQGLLEDCNGDGLADIGQATPRVELNPDAVFLAGFPPFETTVSDVFESSTPVEITLTADADLSGNNEYLEIFLNGVSQGRFWEFDGADCDTGVTTTTLTLSPAEWNALGADVTLSVVKSSAVGINCASDTLSVHIAYTGINRAFDANGNGVMDECEEGCNAADLAPEFGTLDLADISAFIAAFTAQQPIADLTGDGVYDLADLSAFISAFTAGCG